MLGYVRAYKPELKFKEYDIYRGYYCSVCKRLMRRYSPAAQLFLSYDVTFFVLLAAAVGEKCISLKKSRCCYNPLKKCHSCEGCDDMLDFGADISVIMAYYKIRDNIADRGFFGRISSMLALPLLSLMHRKAARLRPEAEASVRKATDNQRRIERGESVSIDAAADPSATSLAELLVLAVGNRDSENIEGIRRLGYLVGRYVYIIDAIDDISDDIKEDSFNPLKAQWLSMTADGDKAAFRDYATRLLNMNIGEAVKCFEALDISFQYSIIYNVLFWGLYNSAEHVLGKYGKEACKNV